MAVHKAHKAGFALQITLLLDKITELSVLVSSMCLLAYEKAQSL